jgi:hypothetical protein
VLVLLAVINGSSVGDDACSVIYSCVALGTGSLWVLLHKSLFLPPASTVCSWGWGLPVFGKAAYAACTARAASAAKVLSAAVGSVWGDSGSVIETVNRDQGSGVYRFGEEPPFAFLLPRPHAAVLAAKTWSHFCSRTGLPKYQPDPLSV